MLKSLLAAVVTLALLTCPFPARAYEKTILKVGMGDPIDSEMGAIGTRFKEVVEARSEGKVEVQLFPSGQLGDETERTCAPGISTSPLWASPIRSRS